MHLTREGTREPSAVATIGPIELPCKIDGEKWMSYLDYECLHREALRHAEELDRLREENSVLQRELGNMRLKDVARNITEYQNTPYPKSEHENHSEPDKSAGAKP
jgi:hypothetical protein